jgi:hypothetical protein
VEVIDLVNVYVTAISKVKLKYPIRHQIRYHFYHFHPQFFHSCVGTLASYCVGTADGCKGNCACGCKNGPEASTVDIPAQAASLRFADVPYECGGGMIPPELDLFLSSS